MKAAIYSVLFLSILFVIPGCSRIINGDGHLVKNKIIVKNFEQLSVACTAAEIHYVQSDSASGLSITTDRNVHKMLSVIQSGSEIIIRLKNEYKDKWVRPTCFTITANSKILKEINLAGKATFNLDSPLHSEMLEIRVAGAGTINLKDSLVVNKLSTSIAGSSTVNAQMLDVKEILAEIAGSGTYNLAGTAKSVSFQVAGKGHVEALDLKASDVSCEVAGYGNMEIYATDNLNLEIAGFGRIKYKGNPGITQEGFAFVRKVN